MTMIDICKLQARLRGAGYAIGAVDGVAGAKTMTALMAAVAGRPMAPLLPLGGAAAIWLAPAGLLDTSARLANWLGQAAHETGGYRVLREIWGPTDAQRGYEGREDLGNTQPGDGKRYLGRGLFQITGRAAYRIMGGRIGMDLEAQPEMAELAPTAVRTACEFWNLRKLSALADAGADDAITHRINGGENGIDSRRRYVLRAKTLLI
ncbi:MULTISPECIES: glycoside hydrolase [unclassified Novosphingobium]|uniref:glycoside hydrolase n=2 Tax=Novosphingobium TaxID=165696 RepID=UPI000D48A772|nr:MULTISPECIES: glycoside hydrolase [unclassified Novosphingobium]PTR07532.1 putative chitinase [Novosphingobium sp. GV055]PUB00234.1 putative chitinase [Novosphingobium sp. GV061]PUB15275.1 putative chitinase [Novosphingobium sp. GV079]PUB39151.1 putative chitinase [Novosphingobium sp. GV027]